MKKAIWKWINKKILQKKLKKGYKAMEKLNLKICEDFKFVDGENLNKKKKLKE